MIQPIVTVEPIILIGHSLLFIYLFIYLCLVCFKIISFSRDNLIEQLQAEISDQREAIANLQKTVIELREHVADLELQLATKVSFFKNLSPETTST